MTKTLSKGKSNYGSKHGDEEAKEYSCDKRRVRTYFGKAKRTVLCGKWAWYIRDWESI